VHREPSDRRALQSVALQFVTNGMVYATIVPRLPDIRDRVGVSIGTLGLILTFGSIAGLVATLLTGRVIPAFGSRNVMTFGGAVMVLALPIIGFARTPWLLVVGLMLWLFLDVFVDVAMNVQGSALSARRHTPVMNRLHGFWSLGTVAGGAVSVLLLRAGVSTPAQLTGTAVVLAATLAFIAPGLLRRDEAPELDEATASIGSAGGPARWVDHRVLTVAVLAAGGATAMAIEMVNGDWASFRLGDDLDARPGIAGLGFLVFTTGMMIGRLGGDFVQVRVGATRLVRVACVVIAVGTVLATLVPVVAVSVAGFLVAGLGTSVLFPQLYDRAARTPGPPGSGFSSMLLGQRGAAVVAPALIGGLADTSAFGVGQAMAIVVLPCAAVIALTTYARI
jgi:MFS family permease